VAARVVERADPARPTGTAVRMWSVSPATRAIHRWYGKHFGCLFGPPAADLCGVLGRRARSCLGTIFVDTQGRWRRNADTGGAERAGTDCGTARVVCADRLRRCLRRCRQLPAGAAEAADLPRPGPRHR